MELSAQAIIEEIIDPLMTGALADSFPNIELRRITPNAVEINFQVPEGAYIITVEPRQTSGAA